MATVNDIVKGALRIIGSIRSGGSPDANAGAEALAALNMMISNWSIDGTLTVALIRESLSISASAASYAIGSGQTLDTTKPLRITSAFLRDSNGIDTGLNIIDRETFDSYPDKDIEGTPTELFYDPGASQQATNVGTIYLYPEASAAMTLFLESEKPWTEFALLTSTVTFPAYYQRAFKFNLAVELAVEKGRELPQSVYKIAEDSLRLIQSISSRRVIADMEFGRGGNVNITSGGY